MGSTLPEGLRCHVAALDLEVLRDDELVDRAAYRFVRRVAEERGGGWVPTGHALVGIHDDDGGRTDLDEHLEVLPLLFDLREQAGVLDRHADVRGNRGEQP